MGQYYRPILKSSKAGQFTVFNRFVNGEYTMAKLMEHSWWGNYFCDAISKMLYNKPKQVAWVGDYASNEGIEQSGMTVEHIHEVKGKGVSFTEGEFSLDNKFLCNHTKHIYIDLNRYKEKSTDKDGWVINPIPLLTAVGNGNGGGDYWWSEVHKEDVGSWAFDIISVKDKPLRGCKEVDIYFKE